MGTPRLSGASTRPPRYPVASADEAATTLELRFKDRPADLARLLKAARFGAWVGTQLAWLRNCLPWLKRIDAALARVGPPAAAGYPDLEGNVRDLRGLMGLPADSGDKPTGRNSRPRRAREDGKPTGPESLEIPQAVYYGLLIQHTLTRSMPRIHGLEPLGEEPLALELEELSDPRVAMGAVVAEVAEKLGRRVSPTELAEFAIALSVERPTTDKHRLMDNWRKKLKPISRARRFFAPSGRKSKRWNPKG